MAAYPIHFFLVYSSLLSCFAYGNGWYLDKSCDSRKELFKTGMRQAFLMYEASLAAIGNSPDGGSAKWVFPEQETRDMAARIFGTSFDVSFQRKDTFESPTVNKFSVVRDNLAYILETFKNPTDDPKDLPSDDRSLKEGDIVFFCTMDRWKLLPDGSKYFNPNNIRDGTLSKETYDKCNNDDGGYQGFTQTPQPEAYNYIQMCPRFFRNLDKEPNQQTLDDFKKIETEDIADKFAAWCSRKSKAEPDKHPIIDMYKNLFEMTLFHEMTHSVWAEWRPGDEATNDINKKYPNRWPTIDAPVGSEKGYGWTNVWKLKDGLGWNNADSFTYFGMASRILKERALRTKFNGCPEKIKGSWNFDTQMSSGTKEPVDGGWQAPKFKRNEPNQPLLLHPQPNGRRSELPPYPMLRRQASDVFPTGFITTTTTFGTGIASPITPISQNMTNGSTTSFQTSSGTLEPLSSTFNLSTEQSVTSLFTTSSSSIVESLSGSTIPPSSIASEDSSMNQTLSTNTSLSTGTQLPSSVDTSGTTTSSSLLDVSTPMSSLSPSLSGTNSSGLNESVPVSTSMDSQTAGAPVSNTASITSATAMSSLTTTGTESSRTVDGLLSSFWDAVPTVSSSPVSSSEIMAAVFCTDALLDGCVLPTGFSLEKLVTATEVDIPEVTDISIFPHIDVDGVAVVKMNLPKDKCEPIPKPSGGGLLGGLFKVASNVVNGVIDAACNLEVPVIKGGKLPKGFNFGSFPHPTSFPPLPPVVGPPQEPGKPEETPQSNDPTSSTSSCQQTVFSSCDVSQFVNSTVTRASQSCSTTTACSGADITKVTATTWSCSPTAIQDCSGTAFVSGSGTTSFATACSTRTTCSGSGVTSVSTVSSSAAPEPTYIIDDEDQTVVDERSCVLDLLLSTDKEIDEAEYLACFGEQVDPSASANASSSSVPASTTSSATSQSSSEATPHSSDQSTPSNTTSSAPPPAQTTPPCLGSTPLNECEKKDGKCMCKTDVCPIIPDPSFDCYSIPGWNCDDDCNNCWYPYCEDGGPGVEPPPASSVQSAPSNTSGSAPPPAQTTPPCKGSTPLDDCKKKDGKCMCKTDVCPIIPDPSFDCYSIPGRNCDDDCNNCWYPHCEDS